MNTFFAVELKNQVTLYRQICDLAKPYANDVTAGLKRPLPTHRLSKMAATIGTLLRTSVSANYYKTDADLISHLVELCICFLRLFVTHENSRCRDRLNIKCSLSGARHVECVAHLNLSRRLGVTNIWSTAPHVNARGCASSMKYQ